MWINDLQIAIIEKDTDKLDRLLDAFPEFEDKQQMEKAAYLLKEALELLYTLRDETSESMKQIKKNLDFLNSTHGEKKNKLDVKF